MISCKAACAASVLGKKWTIALLQEINAGGGKGFNHLLKRIKKTTPRVLSSRLKELERQDLVTKTGTTGKTCATCKPGAACYSLTTKGRELNEIALELKAWNERNHAEHAGCTTRSCVDCPHYF